VLEQRTETIPFVGRARELALLRGAWQRARDGRTTHVLVSGEAGAGKTRLVDELCAGVRAEGGAVLRGRCWEHGGAPAYWPWIQTFASYVEEAGETMAPLLRGLDPALVRLLPRLRSLFPAPLTREDGGGDAADLRLGQAVIALLARFAAERPLLIVLDDLEAADLPSVRLLRFLVHASDAGSDLRVLLLGLRRTPVPAAAPAAPTLDELAGDPAVAALGVGGLGPVEIGEMLSAVSGGPVDEAATAAVHARSGGNPLFASQLIRLLGPLPAQPPGQAWSPPPAWSPLPAGIRAVIEQRLGGLPPACRRLLEAGAVAGHEVDLDVVADVADLGGAPVSEAVGDALAAAVVLALPGRPRAYAFAHPLVRDCLYEALPVVARAELHGRLGDALGRHHAGALDDHLDVIASHYVAALPVGWAPRAFELCRLAARRAAALGARDECVRLLSLALEALPAMAPDVARWCELSLELGEAQDRAGRVHDARATFMRVAERAERDGLPRLLARAAVGFGGRFIWARPTGDAREVPMLERALGALGLDAPELQALVLARRSILRRDLAGAGVILAGCRRAVALARDAGDATAFKQTLGALVFALGCLGGSDETLAAIDELAAIAQATGDLEQTVQATIYRAAASLENGDAAGAEAGMERCEALEQALRQPVHRWLRLFSRAEIAFFRGRLAEAELRSEEARRMGQELGRPESAAIHLVSFYLIRREQGRCAEIEEMVRQARAAMPGFSVARCLPGHLAAELGREDEARAFLDKHVESGFAELLETSTYRLHVGLLTEMAAWTGHAAAAEVLRPILASITQPYLAIPGTVVLGPTRRAHALLAGVAGDWPEAARLLREAAAACRTVGAPCWALRCELDLARAILVGGSGDAAEGRRLLAAVAAEAEAAGYGGVAASARRLAESTHAPGPTAERPAAALVASFRREGAHWEITYAGARVTLPDAKGLRYLATLLAREGEELAVMALVAADATADAGDPEAAAAPAPADLARRRAAFERRLEDLNAEIEEAARWNDLERGHRARRERERLASELAQAMGLARGATAGGGAPAKRMRQSVAKAIKAAIERITREHAALGRHLESTVRTGLYCRYQPDPLHRPNWRVDQIGTLGGSRAPRDGVGRAKPVRPRRDH
jgi:hypothetical protein